jgi:glycosyltransferase involved in cell wall biosynthesis
MVVCNEEARLADALRDIRPLVDEIVVVVQESADRTLEIARELADIAIEHPAAGYCEYSRPDAMKASTGDWILALDADERLSEYAKEHLRAWVANRRADFYFVRELTLIDGVQIEDDLKSRLFRAGHAFHKDAPHSSYEPTGGSNCRIIDDRVVIEHFKSRGEQTLDDERYSELKKAGLF